MSSGAEILNRSSQTSEPLLLGIVILFELVEVTQPPLALVVEIIYVKVFGKLSKLHSYSYIPFICTSPSLYENTQLCPLFKKKRKQKSTLSGPAALLIYCSFHFHLRFICCKAKTTKKEYAFVVSNSLALSRSLALSVLGLLMATPVSFQFPLHFTFLNA